jgi:deoxyribonuclease V
VQRLLAADAAVALARTPWRLTPELVVGGCFVAFASGEHGPGRAGDRAWAAAVTWRPGSTESAGAEGPLRRPDRLLRGSHRERGPRRASDVDDQVVVADRVSAPYHAGLLALREGPILERVVSALIKLPDLLLVDGTGLDHPRRAGLAIHLGAVFALPTVGVTHRPLVAVGGPPPSLRRRGASTPLQLDDHVVGRWTCTKSGVRPVLAHAAWRTDADTAAAVVLAASTRAARTPVPLQEARRVAREARAGGL